MPTISTTTYPLPAYVRVTVDWSDYPQVTHARVVRRNLVTGELVTLRPHTAFDADGNMLLSCGSGVWWDTEPPLNVEFEYCTYAADPLVLLTANSDFEVTTLPWQQVGVVLARSPAFPHSGTWSGQIIPGGGDGGRILNTFLNPVLTVGVPVVVQAWALAPFFDWNGTYLTAYVTYDDGDSESFSSEVYILDATYRFMTFSFTISKPGFLNGIQFAYVGPAPAGTEMYVDDIGVYQTQLLADVSECSNVITIFSEDVFLKNPLDPCLDVTIGLCNPAMDFDCEEDVRISYLGTSDEEIDANTVLSLPVNRRNPIPTNRMRRSPRAELRLLAHDCTSRDRVFAVNDPGTPLLFQAPPQYCIADRYISVGMITEARISVDQREAFRSLLLPYAVVDRPAGPANGVCGVQMGDLCDIYTTWSSLIEFGEFTYLDLIQGLASYDSPVYSATMRTWGEVELEFVDWAAVEDGGARDWGELRDGF